MKSKACATRAQGTRPFVYLPPSNVGKSSVTVAGWFVFDLDETMAGGGRGNQLRVGSTVMRAVFACGQGRHEAFEVTCKSSHDVGALTFRGSFAHPLDVRPPDRSWFALVDPVVEGFEEDTCPTRIHALLQLASRRRSRGSGTCRAVCGRRRRGCHAALSGSPSARSHDGADPPATWELEPRCHLDAALRQAVAPRLVSGD